MTAIDIKTDAFLDPNIPARERLSNLIEEKKRVETELSTLMKAEGAPLLTELLDEHAPPILEGLAWSQYTPYFNDGEECVFGVNEPNFIFIPDDILDAAAKDDEDSGDPRIPGIETYGINRMDSDYAKKYMSKRLRKMCEDEAVRQSLMKVLETFHGIPDVLFKEAFGDHAVVVLNLHTGKATVDYYEHD